MFFDKFKDENLVKILLSLGILIIVIYLIKDMIDLFLLTFLFSFIFYNIQNYLFQKMKKLKVKRAVITIVIYSIVIAAPIFLLYKYLPILIEQLISLGTQINNFRIEGYQGNIDPRIINAVRTTIQSYTENTGSILPKTVTSIWTVSFDTLIAFILSLFFVLEKEPLLKFIRNLEHSHIGFVIKFYGKIGSSFLSSFGKVMKVQIQIAFINSILSMIFLSFLGFPQILGLGFMIFMLGLVPVAGVFISLIPLSIIAYELGGFIEIIYVIILIVALHTLEAYILNPKLMSIATKLPVFLTFIILIISGHFFGIWGLLFGVPVFLFLMDLLYLESPEQKNRGSGHM